MNKFKTKRGLCTAYALTCGYMDIYTAGHSMKCIMELDGVYHVKLCTKYKCTDNVINGTQHIGITGDMWYWQTYDTLGEARKGYALAKREVKRVYEL